MFYETVILYCQKKFQNERTISAVYHLLKGKQSIQTIQDAYLFDLRRFYGIHKQLSKENFINTLDQLTAQNLLHAKTNNNYVLTENGENFIHQNKSDNYYFNGMKYRQIDDSYYLRLLLLIQVWTNSMEGNSTYIPITENTEIEKWVKSYYQFSKHQLSFFLKTLYKELIEIFSFLPEKYPELFIHQITTYKAIGLTNEQISRKYEMSTDDVHLMTTNMIHFILSTVTKEKEKYRLLYSISEGLMKSKNSNHLTSSATKTYELLKQDFTLHQVAMKRKLKINTIYDHVVEIALHDEQFSIVNYVTTEEEKQIIQGMIQANSYKLKEIKNFVSERISYFQIRLVLAKMNNGEGNENKSNLI